jgi:hypothetical protein
LIGNNFGENVFAFGGGIETAVGGARSNLFQVYQTTGQATIDLSAAANAKNEIDFVDGLEPENLWFEQVGYDLKIDVLGSNTSATVANWFVSDAGLHQIGAGGLKIDRQLSLLVQAMSTYSTNNTGFDPTSPGSHAMPNDPALQGTIATAWHA